MKNLLEKLDRKSLGLVRQVGELAQEKGVGAYLVGGPVRDLILKRKIVDLDFVIEGDAIKLAVEFARRHKAQCVQYPAFKTATVVLLDGVALDFASTRREIYAYPGALPTVTAAGIADDLFRRDFSLNAIAISVTPKTFGVLVDPYDGLGSIKHKLIRVLHAKSFIDDPTRLLRAVRFEARLKFRMDKETLTYFREAVMHKASNRVKPQRYFEEFKKILKEEDVAAPLARLRQLQALKIAPLDLNFNERRVALIKEVRRSLQFCSRHGLKGVEAWVVYLMAILEEEKPDDLAFILGQLGFSAVDNKKLVASLSFPKVLGKLSSKYLKASWVCAFLKPYPMEAIIFFRSRADESARRRIDKYLLADRHVKLAIDGDDLKRLGIPAGARMKQVLDEVLGALIDGKVKHKEQQLKYAKALGGE